jgi:hypothetical protein
VTEFNAGRQGPWPSASRHQAQIDHEREVRDEAEHEHSVRAATGKHRRRWWPFGRRSRTSA